MSLQKLMLQQVPTENLETETGIVTRREINELKQSGKTTPRKKMDFELNCRAFLTRTTAKLLNYWRSVP